MEHLETARHALYVPNSLFNKQKWKGSERLETSRPLSGGGEEEDRTPDLCIANAALSQLSYPPRQRREIMPLTQILRKRVYSLIPHMRYSTTQIGSLSI